MNKCWSLKLKKHELEKKDLFNKPSKLGLIFKTHNSRNLILKFNQETQFQINLILNDKK